MESGSEYSSVASSRDSEHASLMMEEVQEEQKEEEERKRCILTLMQKRYCSVNKPLRSISRARVPGRAEKLLSAQCRIASRTGCAMLTLAVALSTEVLFERR